MEYIRREIEKELAAVVGEYSVVTITGPRQSGKTTLVKNFFPSYTYQTLESPDTRALALSDPRKFLEAAKAGIILDEIHNAPELLSYIQEIVDADKKARFVLTGSNNFSLIQFISQSLAGRTALLKLLPLSWRELPSKYKNRKTDELLLSGFYPGIYSDNKNPTRFYRNTLCKEGIS